MRQRSIGLGEKVANRGRDRPVDRRGVFDRLNPPEPGKRQSEGDTRSF